MDSTWENNKRLGGGEGLLSAVKLFTLGWKKSKSRLTDSSRRSDTDGAGRAVSAGAGLARVPSEMAIWRPQGVLLHLGVHHSHARKNQAWYQGKGLVIASRPERAAGEQYKHCHGERC